MRNGRTSVLFIGKVQNHMNGRNSAGKASLVFFITPAIKAHYDDGSCECWRNCGYETARHYHIFWDCKNIKNYWREVHKVLQNIFGTYLPFDFKSIFLGYIPSDIKGIDKWLQVRRH